MARTLRWGILGTGNIARQFVAGLHASPRHATIAVGSRRPRSARQFATAHGVSAACGSYDDVLDDSRVDVVYVALPNALHHPWTIAALRAGKHVLCEKPIAANRPEAEEMFDTADRKGRVLAEGFMYRSHPLLHKVKQRVREGAIGKVVSLHTSFCFATRKVRGNVRFSQPLAGGALMDIGCYCINFSRFFAGSEPSRITASARLHRSGVDIFTAATLQFPNGIIASFSCGMDTQADNTAMISGSDGYLQIPVPWKPGMQRNPYVVAQMPSPRQDGPQRRTTPRHRTHYVAARRPLFTLEADDFARCVFAGTPPVVGRHDAVGNMQVLDDVRRAVGVHVAGRRRAGFSDHA